MTRYLKAIVAGAIGTALPLLIVSLTTTFDWKAILAAALTGGASAVGVYVAPNTVQPVKQTVTTQTNQGQK